MKIVSGYNAVWNSILLRHFRVIHGQNFKIRGRLVIKGEKNRIVIKDDCCFNSDKSSVPIGFFTPISFWCMGNGKITIGNHCGISNAAFCSSSSITIGNNVLIGGGVKIYDTDFHSLDYTKRVDIVNDNDRKTAPVVINDDAFIGAGTIILKGVQIGERSIVAAGSVVCKNIPADEVWGGNPAKYIREV